MVKYEIWVLTGDRYRRILVDTPEMGRQILESIEVKDDDWID